MWDHTSPKDTIELNGTLFLVGHSLWTFLDEMRSQGRFRTYWIDAICIDQSNIQERNHQVQLMKTIYSEAESVSIWLGSAEEGNLCIEAMKFLKDMDTRSLDDQSMEIQPIPKAINFTQSQCDAISALCQVAYWERMWIFQEVVLAREATMCYGSWTVRFSTFQRVMPAVSSARSPAGDERKTSSFAYNLCMYRWFSRDAPMLHSALQCCRARKATDIRDRIYGLLGLVEAEPSIEVDYQITPLKLWMVVVAHLYEKKVEGLIPWYYSISVLGEVVAQALELDSTAETMISFIEEQYMLPGRPFESAIFAMGRL